MKLLKLIVLSGLLSLSSLSFAQSNPELAKAMEEIGNQFKTVAISLRSQSIDENTVLAAQNLSAAITVAKDLLPATAPTEGDVARYRELMEQLEAKSVELAQVAEAGDFDALSVLFREMNALRVTGHEEFKPQD